MKSITDDEIDRLTLQAFDDLHRIAEALEKIAVNGLIGQMLVEKLTEISLHVGTAVSRIRS